jgi:tetratricopeptide (TPR) repeat protein
MDVPGVIDLINKGNLEAAESIIGESVKLNGSSPDPWYLKGLLSLSRQEYENAIEFLTKSRMLGRGGDDISRALGYSHFSMFSMDDAIDSFAAIRKKMADDYFMLGIAYLLVNDPQSSKEYIHTAHNTDPARAKSLLQLFYVTVINPSTQVTEDAKKALISKINSVAKASIGGESKKQ